MNAASTPRDNPLETRLLVVDTRSRQLRDQRISQLPKLLSAGDLLIVNDAATLPASLPGVTSRGEPIELRLTGIPRSDRDTDWLVVVMGKGNWRDRTEDRGAPPQLAIGETITLGEDRSFQATVTSFTGHPRLVRARFDRSGAALWQALYRSGRPVQYSYVARPFAPWDVQTVYSARPWAAEMPSAGRPLTWGLLLDATRRGVKLASITHAAGLSSTGDVDLDRRLPLDERYEIPRETLTAIEDTRRVRGRVIAVGTSVVRALESCLAERGKLVAGEGVASLRIGPGFLPRVIDGLLTGIHDPSESHFDLIEAFAPHDLLRAAHAHALEHGYLGHELGDSALILPGVAA